MAFNNNNYGNRGGYNSRPAAPAPKVMRAEALPENYVDIAEGIMTELKGGRPGDVITTSKLRNLFGLFAELFNEVTHDDCAKLSRDQVNALTAARVRIVYEIGRDKNKGGYDGPVGIFAEKAKLVQYLMGVGDDPVKFKDYYHYFEALVAYHRFCFGNNDKA